MDNFEELPLNNLNNLNNSANDLVEFDNEIDNEIDNKIETIKSKKCLECKTYFAQCDKNYCSDCEFGVLYHGIDLSIEQIINLPKCSFKSKQINEHLEEIYDVYKIKKGLQNKLIKNINLFKTILNICKGKTPQEIFTILDGQTDYCCACLLPYKYADQLLEQSLENCPKELENNKYKYVHAIAPFYFDVWNSQYKDSVFECYYKNLGQLTRCPTEISHLYELWNRCVYLSHKVDLNGAELCNCKVCNKIVKIEQYKIRCKSCYNYFHTNCVDTTINSRCTKCPMCSAKWNINKIDRVDYGSVFAY